ncbi:efflux RND transporter periplasmic adaptor subunit [uncultured Parabacteroides sp.]|uniref:efflux RND transporter periplasmic adaptor subunit n=1 Tax=uncultured Parabacteroides sp. TaxID=512312 RepID=UPI0025903956|nr:efflux RND transporter periplasmic adaptor subunit [uncultured Parabacteroides sp.]
MRKIYLLWVLCAYLLAGCSGGATKQDEHDHDHEAHEHEEGHDHDHEGHDHEHEGHDHGKEAASGAHANEIIFKEELAKAVGLQTKVVEPAPFTDVIKTSGSVLAAQGDETTVVATVPGIVTFGSLSFVDGAAVRKGQAILSLASSTLSDGNVAARAKYAYENAKKEYERMEQLVGDKIVSAKDFEQARLNYENAKVAYEAIAGKQTANGVSVVSPMNGYLKNLQVKEGDYVAVGQPLATISQNSRLVLRAEVSEKYYKYLPAVQSANFRTPYDEMVYKLSDLHGRILSYGKASDANSFYIPVTFEFDNKGAVIPGSFVEIYLLASPMEDVLSVPVSALIEEQGIYSVFIRLDEEGYQKREVKLGANNGSEVQILSGLKPGETVVTQGAYQIKLASASNAIPAHTHNH